MRHANKCFTWSWGLYVLVDTLGGRRQGHCWRRVDGGGWRQGRLEIFGVGLYPRGSMQNTNDSVNKIKGFLFLFILSVASIFFRQRWY